MKLQNFRPSMHVTCPTPFNLLLWNQTNYACLMSNTIQFASVKSDQVCTSHVQHHSICFCEIRPSMHVSCPTPFNLPLWNQTKYACLMSNTIQFASVKLKQLCTTHVQHHSICFCEIKTIMHVSCPTPFNLLLWN
jgi:hypothetical protein